MFRNGFYFMKWWEILLALLGILVGGSGISAIFIAIMNNRHNQSENEKDRKHKSLENEKDRQNKLKIEEEKTKRLILQLQNAKDIERKKINQENSNSPTSILNIYRKCRKGKQ